MSAGREYYLALQLLDRQLVDRDDRLVGKVDDAELEPGDSGQMYVTAILSGPGVLARRLRLRRYGEWVEAVHRRFHGARTGTDPSRIPFTKVVSIGSCVQLAADQEELATQSTQRWAAEHIICHIPGATRAAE